jgi:flagellin
MALTVNTNLFSLNSQRALMSSESDLKTAMARLSSGLRINSAKDDAAGLYTVEKMTADVRGQSQAIRNAADGISLAQVAEGALGQIANNLQRIREIAVQAANGTTEDLSGLQSEVDQLTQEISRIVQTTKFNGKDLLNSSAGITFQVGEDADAASQLTVNAISVTGISAYAASLTGTNTINLTGAAVTGSAGVIGKLEADIATVAKNRATFGAVQNRFEAVISNLSVSVENVSAARSRLQDADFAVETAKLTRAQILQQAGVAMLAQANAAPQTALALLK